MEKQKKSIVVLTTLVLIASALLLPQMVVSGDLEPSAAPAPTMKTLDQIPPTWSMKLPAAERFVVLADFNNEAVLDKETGLVWERTPASTIPFWTAAAESCVQKVVGDRRGWRLPSVEELASLVDPQQSDPALPIGHPFGNIQNAYWSDTTTMAHPTSTWVVLFGDNGGVMSIDKTTSNCLVWCVRGGQGHDGQ